MTGRQALAQAFGAWIDANLWTQADVVNRGGPSTTTQTKIRSTDEPLSRQTLKQVDKVMGWEPGTSALVLGGRTPPAPHGTVGPTDDDEASQSEIRTAMEKAFRATNLTMTEDNLSRAGSVLVAMRQKNGVAEMAQLKCIGAMDPATGLGFPEAAALCATQLR